MGVFVFACSASSAGLFFSGCSLEVLCFVVFWFVFFLLFNQVKDRLGGNHSFSLKTTSASQSQRNKAQANRCSEEPTMSP